MISMVVVAFITAAMITVMSAFAGIEDLVEKLFAHFDPPVSIVPAEGRTITDSAIDSLNLAIFPGVRSVHKVIQEDAWLTYADFNTVATLKGVDPAYAAATALDSMIYFGVWQLETQGATAAVLGLGVKAKLRVPIDEIVPSTITINTPIRGKKLSRYRENAFRREPAFVTGAFSVNAELDEKYFFVSLDFARDLYDMPDEISAVELRLLPGTDEQEVANALKAKVPAQMKVITKMEKNALVYQTNASEKWATFLILLFILLIACFNIVASLTMLIIEKKKDITVLDSMGATPVQIHSIFILEGVFINFTGAIAGTLLGVGLCWLQQTTGLIRMQGAMVEYYPVQLEPWSVVGIFFTVVVVGSVFSGGMVALLMRRLALNKHT
jgi:lipoprotein-releasing system permease protein